MTVSETSARPPSPSELADMPPCPPQLVRILNPKSVMFDETLRKAYHAYSQKMKEMDNRQPPPEGKRIILPPLNQPESP